jgi:hypothetical protein
MDVRRRNALAVYWSPCSLAYAMSVVVSLEMATDTRKTPPVSLQRSRIPTLIPVTSAFFCAISLLFAGSAGEKTMALMVVRRPERVSRTLDIYRTTCRPQHVPRGCLMLSTIAAETTANVSCPDLDRSAYARDRGSTGHRCWEGDCCWPCEP